PAGGGPVAQVVAGAVVAAGGREQLDAPLVVGAVAGGPAAAQPWAGPEREVPVGDGPRPAREGRGRRAGDGWAADAAWKAAARSRGPPGSAGSQPASASTRSRTRSQARWKSALMALVDPPAAAPGGP